MSDKIIIKALLDRFRSLSEGSVVKPETKSLRIEKVRVPFSIPTTINARGKANIKAIQLVSSKLPSEMTNKDRDAVRKYTGFGGFPSVVKWNEQIKDPNFIITEGAITYEYYTPFSLTYSIRQKILPIIMGKKEGFLKVPKWDKKYLALEPSAGIGRFVDPFYTKDFQWNSIEPSVTSAKMLLALYPEAMTNITTFDKWAFRNKPVGIYSLILGNPPYKKRGKEIREDPNWVDFTRSEQYQLIRTLPMLNKGGLSVMVIPRETLSGTDKRNKKVREEMLKYAHLIGAVRLPTHSLIDGKIKDAVFFNVATPIDVLFLQARGGKLKEVKKDDLYILEGQYFDRYPNHIMGVIQKPEQNITIDGVTIPKAFRFTRIIMKGKFEGLVDFKMRPMKSSSKKDFIGIIEAGKTTEKRKRAEKAVRVEKDNVLDSSILQTMDDASQEAYHIAPKIQNFIKNVELNTKVSRMEAFAAREGINVELRDFVDKYGNPHKKNALRDLRQKDIFRYNIFMSVFDKDGRPIKEVSKPTPLRFEYNGDVRDYNNLLHAWYRHSQKTKQFPVITKTDFEKIRRSLNSTDKTSFEKVAIDLASKGWCLQPSEKSLIYWIMPQARYYEGNLWKRYDALKEVLKKSIKNKALLEIYKKQFSMLVDPNPKTTKSLMDLATFPDLLNERKILPSSPFVSQTLLNRFFDTLRSYRGDMKVVGGVSRLAKPKIIIRDNKYFIAATEEDLYKTMEKLLENSYSIQLVMKGELVKDDYGGITILKQIFPSVYKVLAPKLEKHKTSGNRLEKLTGIGSLNDEKFFEIDGKDLEPAKGFGSLLAPKQQMFFGMLTKRSKLFKPTFNQRTPLMNTKLYSSENSFGAKVRIRREFEDQFLDFLGQTEQEKYWQPITDEYNRRFRGYVEPDYSQGEDLVINGWKGFSLRPYQSEAVRKMIYQKQGLLAFDVGLGKTITGIATIAIAKQQGWCQRPLIVVPNSILFKWKDDILKALPQWKIVTIGATQYRDTNGNLKSKTDTPEERGRKWLQFSLGAYDVALLTYSMLNRTQFREKTYDLFSDKHIEGEEGISQKIQQKRKSGKSEAKLLSKKEAIQTKIEEMLLPSKDQRIFDKGVTWEDIGVDLLLVDESQNFKSLFNVKTNFSQPPKFMGTVKPSKKAYNLDIRCMQVREVAQKKYGSNNIFLLSATPAKNSPIEFYNLIQYIDPNIFLNYGIRNSGDFYDRFLKEEHGQFYNSRLEVQEYPQIRSFINLDDFRHLLKKYCTFEVFETIIKKYPQLELSIKVPSVNNKQVRIKMNSEQRRIIDEILYRMGKVDLDEDGVLVQSEVPKDQKISPIEGIIKMLAACIHPILLEDKFKIFDDIDEVPDDPDQKKRKKRPVKKMSTTAIQKVLKKINLHSPKLDAVVSNIVRLRGDPKKRMGMITCGNIVFIQNIAVQYMIRDLLVQAGLPKYSIGIMNASELPDPQSRQNMSRAFNFISEFFIYGDRSLSRDEYESLSESQKKKAKRVDGYQYDIIIANSIAYEGIDLQHRTCAIHHVDLAWESATITQRNGRGIRSGNEYEDVDVYYYLMENSVDQYIYLTIQGKREWLVSAIQSQDREINNLGASETSADTLLLLTSSSQADFERRKAIAQKNLERKRMENQKKVIFAQIKKVGLLFQKARETRSERDINIAQLSLDVLRSKDASLYPALYYINQLKFYRPMTFSPEYMYDVVLIKGMLYVLEDGSIGCFLGRNRDQLTFALVYDGEIYRRSQTIDSYINRFDKGINIPYDVGGGYDLRGLSTLQPYTPDDFVDEVGIFLEGYGSRKKPSEKEVIERKQTFYRWLIKQGRITIVDPLSGTGERVKNSIYKSLIVKKHDDNLNILRRNTNILFDLPREYIIEMYSQKFLDYMLNGNEFFRDGLIVKNTLDDSLWVLNNLEWENKPLFFMDIKTVDKNNFGFAVPTRQKFSSERISLSNVSSYTDATSMNIFFAIQQLKEKEGKGTEYKKARFPVKIAGKNQVLKGFDLRDIVAQMKSKDFVGDDIGYVSYDLIRRHMTNLWKKEGSLELEIFEKVLGLHAKYIDSITDSTWVVGTTPSKSISLGGVAVNYELFSPDAKGFREMEKMIKSRKKIFFAENYVLKSPHAVVRTVEGKEISGRVDINRTNTKYFGITNKLDFFKLLTRGK